MNRAVAVRMRGRPGHAQWRRWRRCPPAGGRGEGRRRWRRSASLRPALPGRRGGRGPAPAGTGAVPRWWGWGWLITPVLAKRTSFPCNLWLLPFCARQGRVYPVGDSVPWELFVAPLYVNGRWFPPVSLAPSLPLVHPRSWRTVPAPGRAETWQEP